ncbi:MAG: hypothetical protein R3276_13275 [Marinobacter sp.]|nr:hypothetical protein [Marinobacter sp.]
MRVLMALGLTILLAGTALAGQCPTLVQQIDTQLETAQLDDNTKQQVMTLRNEGEALHQQGKHGESVQTLNQALELIKESASQ